jgi:hypothetical protein
MGKNRKLNFVEEYDLIKKIMASCKTEEQLKITRNIFQNFKNKWKHKVECFEMIDYMYKFEMEYKKISRRI